MIVQEYSNSKNVTPHYYRVATEYLSPEAVAYIRRITQAMRRDGSPLATAAEFASIWAGGYRAYQHGKPEPVGTHAAHLDGWQFAHGEAQYNECMIEQDEYMAVRESMYGAW